LGNVKPCRGPCYGQDLYHHVKNMRGSEAELLDEIHTKVLRVFLLAIHRHLYSFAFKFLFLQTHATSYTLSVEAEFFLQNQNPDKSLKGTVRPDCICMRVVSLESPLKGHQPL